METGAPAKVLSKIHEANISKTPLQGVNRQKSNTKKSRESCKKPQVTLPHSSNAKPTKSDPTFLSVVNANYEAQQPAVFHTPQPSITAQYSMIEHVETCT